MDAARHARVDRIGRAFGNRAPEEMIAAPALGLVSAATLIALAASGTPALAHVAPWSSPAQPPLPIQFLAGIALMAVAGAVMAWEGAALAYEALAHGRKHRRVATRHTGRRCGVPGAGRG